MTVPSNVSPKRVARVAVVTGAASKMNWSNCESFAANGDRVAVPDIDGAAAQRIAERLHAAGGSAMACEVDVTGRSAVLQALTKVRAEFDPIEIPVTSTGPVDFSPFTEITPESSTAEWCTPPTR